jgi:protein-tyrosine phosphatase
MDDGARTREDSLAMLRTAAEHGTTDVVATPHANTDYVFDPARIAREIEELSSAIEAALDGAIRLHTGCDFHLSYENIQDALGNPTKYTINHHNYLLVEFSNLIIFRNTPEIFSRLIDAGMIPIITHPERNSLLRKRLKEIEIWVHAGALIQLTAQSVTGDFGRAAKEFCDVLLDRGLAHFVASDGHDCERRPLRMDQARAWLTEHRGETVSRLLCETNPRAVLTGGPVQIVLPEASAPSGKWYQFWR